MVPIILFLAIAPASQIAQKWNAEQEARRCTIEVQKVDENDYDHGIGNPYPHYQVCEAQARRFPPVIPEGYYPRFDKDSGQGWILMKVDEN